MNKQFKKAPKHFSALTIPQKKSKGTKRKLASSKKPLTQHHTRKFTTSTTTSPTANPPTDQPSSSTAVSKSKTKKNKQPYKRFVSNPPRQVLSGIQPTGVVHIGNLFGAVSNWVSLQYTEPVLRQTTYLEDVIKHREAIQTGQIDSTTTSPIRPIQHKPVLFTVVDLHAITIPRPAQELEDAVKNLTATLLGCGIEPQRAKLFIQSHVTQHTELAWLLTCNTPVSWLYRMTQFKDKSQKFEKQGVGGGENGSDDSTGSSNEQQIALADLPRGVMAGLLQYPTLMAADILLYNATHVPVGDDQTQHLEFVRELARTMNSSFSPIFVEPNHIYNPFATRVMSLRSPENKMSKSDPSEQGKITLTDTNDEITKKIRSAVTDAFGGVTYDQIQRPGLTNLLNIYAASENMQIMTQHNKKIDQQLRNTFFYKNGMLSLDSPLTAGPNSQKLYDFAMQSVTTTQTIGETDPFMAAFSEYQTIVTQAPKLVSPQDLAIKHSTDALSVFKPAVSESLIKLIEPIRNSTTSILKNDSDAMATVVRDGADSAREIALQTVNRTKDVMGMRF